MPALSASTSVRRLDTVASTPLRRVESVSRPVWTAAIDWAMALASPPEAPALIASIWARSVVISVSSGVRSSGAWTAWANSGTACAACP